MTDRQETWALTGGLRRPPASEVLTVGDRRPHRVTEIQGLDSTCNSGQVPLRGYGGAQLLQTGDLTSDPNSPKSSVPCSW